jgi:virginiamycin B lyase
MRLALAMTVAAAILTGTVAASATPRPVARVVTGAEPCGAASGFGSVWVAVYGTGRLVRIDPRSNRVVARIRVARGICPIIVDAGSVWVASDVTNMLYRVDPRRRRIVARIRVADWPAHLAAAFGSVWVSAYERGTVARVDPQTNRVSRVYDIGEHPSGLAEAGGALWIAFGRNGSSVGRLDPRSGALTKSPIGHHGPGFLSAIAGSLWTTTADGFVVRFDPSAKQVVAAFPIPGTPAEAARGPDGMVWVAEKQHNTLTRIDPSGNRIVDVTRAGPGALAIATAGGDMWITSFAGRDIWRFRN